MNLNPFEVIRPLISIVIPVKDAEANFQSIKNILDQVQDKSIEIILVHDIFAESPSQRLESLIKSYSLNFKFLKVKAGNPGSARNAGLELASGNWLTFWDADDETNLENLISMVLAAQKSGCDLCVGSFQIREAGVLTKHCLKLEKNINQILYNPGIWRFSFKSDLIENLRFPQTKMAEDQVFILQLRLTSRKIYFSEKIVYTYINGSSMQLTNSDDSRKEILKSLEICLKHYSRHLDPLDYFDRLLISKIILTTLKIYGLSIISKIAAKRFFAIIGVWKTALLMLALARVSVSTVWVRVKLQLQNR